MGLIFSSLSVLLIAFIIFTSCKSDKKTDNSLNPGNLETYSVSVDITRDTVLQTPDGIMINIPAHALDAGSNTVVKLEIREAIA